MAIDDSAFAPDDVAVLIESVFPGIDRHDVGQTARFSVSRSFMPQIFAILEAVARIPDELLPTESSARLELFAIVAAIRAIVAAWMVGRTEETFLEYLPGIADRHPLDALRRAMLRHSSSCASVTLATTADLKSADSASGCAHMDEERRMSRKLHMMAAGRPSVRRSRRSEKVT